MEIPHNIAQGIRDMADEYGKLGEEYNRLKQLYVIWWGVERPKFKSDTSAERAWDLTDEGQMMDELKLKMKVKEKKMSADKTYLKVLENEARGLY